MKDAELLLAERNWQHQFFYYAPLLQGLSDAENMLRSFLHNTATVKLSMNWAVPMHLLNWLMQSLWQEQMNDDIMLSLMKAAVTRWSLQGLEHVQAKGVLLSSKHLSGHAIGIWKSTAAHQSAKLVQLNLPTGTKADGYHLTTQEGNWGTPNWLMFPT